MSISLNVVQEVIKKHFGKEGNLTRLNGYEDLNFILEQFPEDTKFIVKVSKGPKSLPFLEAQTEVVDLLENSVLKGCFPNAIGGKFGRKIIEFNYNSEIYYLRLLTYLEGVFWVDTLEKTSNLYRSLGGFLGKMDKALEGFDHCAIHKIYLWDINQAHLAEKKLHFIKDHEKRRIASYFLLQFQTEVVPILPDLRKACIHGDANDYNILVNEQHVSGLIDFGDMMWSSLINNLAIACTYAMLHEKNPLEVAAKVIEGYHANLPLLEQEIEILYYLIAARLCISVTQSAEKSYNSSTNEHHFLTEDGAWNLLYQLLETNPKKALKVFRQACGFPIAINFEESIETLLEMRSRVIGKNLSISYSEPLKIFKGALQYLYDDLGNTYVDCVNNVSHVGHCHPVLVKAMQKQIATLNTNTRYLYDPLTEYAKALCDKLPERLTVCYFVNSGSEANDLAIRMARNFTGKEDVIVLDHAYHGTSTLALEMSPYKFDGRGGSGQKPYIHKAISPDLYRGKYQYSDIDAGEKYAESVHEILKNLDQGVAAFICETLLGVGGQIPLPTGYLKNVYEKVRHFGGVCIADEVQVGFGRVGEAFWGFELQEVVPDIVVLGKPIGNGHPLAAVVVTQEIADSFNNGMEYFNTFGGNPVSMVTGITVLNILEEEALQAHAKRVGSVMLEGLNGLKEKYQVIADVRGYGLFVGAEFVKDRVSKIPAVEEINRVVEEMKNKGFLLSTDGPLHNVLKIKPPLVFSEKNAIDLVHCLDEILANF